MKIIQIKGSFIKLDQFLKLVDVASTGGHAKYLILEGHVEVNGHAVKERGKKLRDGDTIRVHIEEEHFTKTYRIQAQ